MFKNKLKTEINNKSIPNSNPFFPNPIGFDDDKSAGGASSVLPSLHCIQMRKVRNFLVQKCDLLLPFC